MDSNKQEFMIKPDYSCLESPQALLGYICEEIKLKEKFYDMISRLRESTENNVLTKGPGDLTPFQLKAFKNLLDSDWYPKDDIEAKLKFYSKEGVQLNQEDLFFLKNNDILYLELEGKDFNYGQILDQYEVNTKIGQGGFGSVYKVTK